MPSRILILSLVFALSTGYIAHASRSEIVPLRQPLTSLPLRMPTWTGRDVGRFSADIERILGVDEYVNRTYRRGVTPPISLYVGYYQSQRQGDTIHSPLNCLPGAGWQPVKSERVDIPVDGRTIHVNRYLIQKGIDKQVVLYWYQSHGRVVASEYWSKAYMVYDAIRLNRTDAALVRVVSPITANETSENAAAERATHFVRELFPLLGAHLPS